MSLQSKIMKHMRKRTTQGQVSMNSFQNQENKYYISFEIIRYDLVTLCDKVRDG